jgi:hypothetical protein
VCLRGNEIKFTVVNGRVEEKENEFHAEFPGETLRHPAPSRSGKKSA